MTRPPLCIHCHVPLKEPVVELHEECTSRLERLWHIVKALADRGEKEFRWNIDDSWEDVAHTLYAPWTGRVLKVTASASGELQYEDVSDGYQVMQKSIVELQQTNQTLKQRIDELEQQLQSNTEEIRTD